MPLAIDEVHSEVTVDGGNGSAAPAATAELPEQGVLWRWRQMQQQWAWDDARTSAADFDD